MTKKSMLQERLGDTQICDQLFAQLLKYIENMKLVMLIIVNQDIAAAIINRSEWGSSGGIGYFDQVHVFYKRQHLMQEYQWRDRYSERNDKPWLKVNELGKIEVSETEDKVVVGVELKNAHYQNRTTDFTFKKE